MINEQSSTIVKKCSAFETIAPKPDNSKTKGEKMAGYGRSGLSTWKYQFSYDH